MYHIADFGNMVQEGELMKYKERMLTRNSFSAAYRVLEYMCDKHQEIDICKHEKNVQLLLLRCLESKKQRTRKKYRKKMVEYYGYAKKNL